MTKNNKTAPDVLRYCQRVARSILGQATHLLDLMATTPRPVVEVNAFYVTFDGSTVWVARRRNKCQCSICTGRAGSNPFATGMFGVLMQAVSQAQQQQAETEHLQSEEDESPEYLCIVFRGGHGIKGISGEEPGDRYVIDRNGWVTMADPDDQDNNDVVSQGMAMICGMSLRRPIELQFVGATAAEKKVASADASTIP